MSHEFVSETKPEILTKEVIDIDQARFVDRLEPEYEQAWKELVDIGEKTGMTIEDLMTPVWLGDSSPRAFRDRAMLSVVGAQNVRTALRQGVGGTNMSFFFGGLSIATYERVVDSFDPALFCKWTQEAWQYQHESGIPIISDERYLTWNYEFFERDLISEAELDAFVDKVDIVASSPTYRGPQWDLDTYPLDKNRFPLLSDVFHSETVGGNFEKTRTWALNRLVEWLRYQGNEKVAIPEWLKAVPEAAGRTLFWELINSGDKPDWLSWDIVRSATNHFGLDILSRHPSRFDLQTVYKIGDPQLKKELLMVILHTQNTKANSGGGYYPVAGTGYQSGSDGEVIWATDIISAIVQDSDDEELKQLFELELEHAADYEERSRQASEEQAREYQAQREASPEYQEQQQAREAFLLCVAALSKSRPQ